MKYIKKAIEKNTQSQITMRQWHILIIGICIYEETFRKQ